ncbi:unnamed protein product, partial [Closterium sp. Naga37s-1]
SYHGGAPRRAPIPRHHEEHGSASCCGSHLSTLSLLSSPWVATAQPLALSSSCPAS